MHDKSHRAAGELPFTIALVAASLFLVWKAYGIAGFSALSSPGAFPMAVAAVMLISALVILAGMLRNTVRDGARFWSDLMPPCVVVLIAMLAAYALLLRPLGFLPTSLLFLTAAIWFLRGGGLGYSLAVSLGSLVLVYIVFRLVFSVLMPAGIVPEGEILAWIGNLLSGGDAR